MQTDKRYATLTLWSLLDQKQGNSTSSCQMESKLQQKLTCLETNYAKMQAEYFKKIRELKNTLIQRARKQASLTLEVNSLRDEFKNHEQQISRITSEIANEKGRSNQLRVHKKNSSPGLLKKSLETQKKIDKHMGPTTNVIIGSNTKNNKNDTLINSNDGTSLKYPKKGYSPTNNIKKMNQIFPSNKQLLNQAAKDNESNKYVKPLNINHSPQANQNKLNQSPKNLAAKSKQIKGILINSLKNFQKQKPQLTNASPKRIFRKSPGALIASKPDKKLVGLKQEVMEAF